ncbi:hypothetical protein C8R48DRAFT_780732 [Suillus tomentosus]|nr:hypothetical protein C8R48DRAFT_780732 [Suillus tomentosus]
MGCRCREPESGETRWAIPLRSLIGHADLSPDETRIAISNQHNGIDVYKIPGAIWLKSYHFKIQDNIILPVYWIDEGLRLIAGSDNGTVRLWNMKNDAQLPSLLHGNCIIRALTAHYDFTTHTCRIATGTAEQGPRTTVHLFETKELREAGATRSPQETPKLSIPLSYIVRPEFLDPMGC